MRYERLAAVGVASTLLLTGCASEMDPQAKTFGSVAVNAQGHIALPPSIEAELGANILQLKDNDIDGNPQFGSAVRIKLGGKALVLTAAHMLAGAVEGCQNEDLYAINNDSSTNMYLPLQQSSVPASSDAAWDGMDRVDAAMIRSDFSSESASNAIPVSTREPAAGTKVVMANFQALPDGTPRDTAFDDGSQWPAIFSGIIVGHFKNKLVVATGHGDSYGQVNDFVTRSGSSGGAALIDNPHSSDNAHLAGLTIETLNSTRTATQIDESYGYQLPEGTYTVGFLEPTTTEKVSSWYQHMLAEPMCSNN